MNPRMVSNYLENFSPNMMSPAGYRDAGGVSKLGMHFSASAPRPPRPTVPTYKTTVTAFGPILPTSVTLQCPAIAPFSSQALSSNFLQPIVPFGTFPKLGNSSSVGLLGPSMYPPVLAEQPGPEPLVPANPPAVSTQSEVIRRILANESSSDSDAEEERLSTPPSSRRSTRRNSEVAEPVNQEFKEQATAVHSPVVAAAPPISRIASLRTPRSERLNRKREELAKMHQFLEESRVAHEKIYSGFDVRRLSTRGPASSSKRRSFSAVNSANNVAELRRNIADKFTVRKSSAKREPSPLPPLPTEPTRRPGRTINTAESRTTSADRPAAPTAVRTPSASARSPKPASPDRLVSGVFVSYPRKRRSVSAPPSDDGKNQSPMQESGNVISSLRPQGSGKKPGVKMTAEEYTELRRNLLNRSEQHAVPSSGTGASLN